MVVVVRVRAEGAGDPPESFFGRAQALVDLGRAAESSRLVTVTGPPGVGKTRLVREWIGSHPRGVFVDLTSVRTLEEACARVAEAVDVSGHRVAVVVERTGQAIRGRRLRVVALDNCEQALVAIRELCGLLLPLAPEATFVLTSRQPLGVRGERVLPLAPLPEVDPLGSPLDAPAVRLLLAAATRVGADPAAIAGSPGALRDIVRLTDGLPLALELAAARLTIMSPEALGARLGDRLSVLSRGPADAPSRQSSLESAIAWSWDLLTEVEQRVLAECSMFRGGFALEAAEAVVTPPAEGRLIDVLHSLHERSLLMTSRGESRFGMLLSIRDFAAARLKEMPLRGAARRRYTAYWAAQAIARDLTMCGAAAGDGAAAVLRDQDNFWCAARWAVADPGEARCAAHCLIALLHAITARGRFAPCEVDLAAVFALLDPERDGELSAQLHEARAHMRRVAGDVCGALADVEAGLAALAGGGGGIESDLHRRRAEALRASEQSADAESAARQAHRVAVAAGDGVRAALALHELGNLRLLAGHAAAAAGHYEDAFAALRARGAAHLAAPTLAALGTCLLELGDHAGAASAYDRAAAASADERLSMTRAYCDGYRGLLALDAGDPAVALEHFQRARDLSSAIGLACFAALFAGYAAVAQHALGDRESWLQMHVAASDLGRTGDASDAAFLMALVAGAHAGAGRDEAARAAVERAAEFPSTSCHVAQVVAVVRAFVEGGGALPADAGWAPRSVEVRLALSFLRRCAEVGPPAPAPAAPIEPGPRGLALHVQGAWFQLDGEAAVCCDRWRLLQRLLVALTRARIEAPGQPVSARVLLAAGWPEESILPRAARNRLHVALHRLRRLGLDHVLRSEPGGWLLAPHVEVELRDGPCPEVREPVRAHG